MAVVNKVVVSVSCRTPEGACAQAGELPPRDCQGLRGLAVRYAGVGYVVGALGLLISRAHERARV